MTPNKTQQSHMHQAARESFVMVSKRHATALIKAGYMYRAAVTGKSLDPKQVPVSLTLKGRSWCVNNPPVDMAD